MKLFTAAQWAQLVANGKQAAKNPEFNPFPVVKLFTPDAGCTWLLAWVDENNTDIAYGLCDLGMGFPEVGPVLISEIEGVRGRLGLPVERDRHWQATQSLIAYANEAAKRGASNGNPQRLCFCNLPGGHLGRRGGALCVCAL